jgi:integrase
MRYPTTTTNGAGSISTVRAKTRRTKGTGSIVHRDDERWEARLRGQSYYLKTKLDAERKLRELLNLRDDGVDPTSQTLKVEAWLNQWIEGQRPPATNVSTYRRYEQVARLYLIPKLGPHPLRSLEPAHVSTMMAELLDPEGGDLALSTIRQVRAILKASLNAAIAERKVSRNVASLAKLAKAGDSEAYPLSPSMALAIVDACGDYSESLKRAVQFGIGVGLRAGEQAALKWSDVDLEGRYLQVRHSLARSYGKGDTWVLADPRTPQSRRRVDLDGLRVQILRDERATQDGSEGYVFRDSQNRPRPYDPRHLQTALGGEKGLLIRADNGAKLTWDAVCREGHGALLLQQGFNVVECAKRLGNTPAVFAKHYAGITTASMVRLGSGLESLGI